MTAADEIRADPFGSEYQATRRQQLVAFQASLTRMPLTQLGATFNGLEPYLKEEISRATKRLHEYLWLVRGAHKSDLEAQLAHPKLRELFERRWDAESIYAVLHRVYTHRIYK